MTMYYATIRGQAKEERDAVLAEARAMLAGKPKRARRSLDKLRRELDEVEADVELSLEIQARLEAEERKRARGRDLRFQKARLSAATSGETARVAYHEAAHAVAAYLEGVEIIAVGLKFDHRSAFHGDGGCSIAGPDSAFVCLAGIAGEHLARNYGRIREVSDDSCWRSDRIKATGHLPLGSNIDLEVARTVDRLKPYWRAIDAVAEALRRDLELDGAEVRRIIARTGLTGRLN